MEFVRYHLYLILLMRNNQEKFRFVGWLEHRYVINSILIKFLCMIVYFQCIYVLLKIPSQSIQSFLHPWVYQKYNFSAWINCGTFGRKRAYKGNNNLVNSCFNHISMAFEVSLHLLASLPTQSSRFLESQEDRITPSPRLSMFLEFFGVFVEERNHWG